ncbi:allophanate hydrolase subunit 1 [Kutzneria viridogrisea]|uniref:Allophanate hydrolase subunit 1 n=2 Tax=Kutzneria TaxID=43356 RepID=W5W7J0_9PSEU|nr:allophanate hydrolase subunit 1 [Kutzneria albida]AHH94169.1 allophanate hydrolase subunit 1 [Kutzneria albida DSM 43870]MBA8929842.1 KipI family sensor histidine kinase inhibitor [Kutzneria viridogrisea]
MRILRCGRRAALVEVDALEQVLGLHACLSEDPPPGLVQLIPASRTLLVEYDPGRIGFDQLATELRGREAGTQVLAAERELVVPVSYDGADLAEVAELTGLTEDEVVARHLAGRYRVAFCGFAPGFGYLDGLDPALHVPRRSTPRVRIPAGSVALAGDYTAVYPRESPGGWQLIGRTELELWDLANYPPTALTPGTAVRFVRA